MKNKIGIFVFSLAFLVKFALSIMVADILFAFLYAFLFLSIYVFMLKMKFKTISFVPFVMIDFIISFYFSLNYFGYNSSAVIFAFVYFAISNGLVYYLIGYYLGKSTSSRYLIRTSNFEVDKGIKALENEDYDAAIEAFSNAIKEHKKNYLGYMGMCNTLSKMDKANLREFNYYRKKCIKYAPKDLKESISKKYD